MFNVGDKVRIIEKLQGKGPGRTRQMYGKVIFANDIFITVEKKAKEEKSYNTSFMINDITRNIVRVAKV